MWMKFKGRPAFSDVSNAFELNGGGLHRLGPGQITDDSELSICLLQGLLEGHSLLNLNIIASKYGKWILSKPFDLGGTLRKSLPKACKMKVHQAEMVRRGAVLSKNSQSNGCLMRISPLAVWARNLTLDEIVIAVKEEVMLTHSNETVQHACCFYVIAIKFLIKTGNRVAAFNETKAYLIGKTNSEFWEWVLMVENPNFQLNVHKPAGWSKIAFVYGFKYLLAGLEYNESLVEILKGGGDTDTNCCIIGALLGAASGLSALPSNKIDKIRAWNPGLGGIKRPEWLRVSYCSNLIDDLIRISPSQLKMVGNSNFYKK